MIIEKIKEFFGFTKKELAEEKKEEPQDELYIALKNLLEFAPGNLELYRLALKHKSNAQRDDKGNFVNNERLEYLGDAVLEAVVSDILYQNYPDKNEGFLTATRSKIVQRETLNEVSLKMNLNDWIVMNSVPHSHSVNIYGNAFEALIGAIYLDKGYGCVLRFVKEVVLVKYIQWNEITTIEQNYKSKLIEWGQRHHIKVEFNTYDMQTVENNNCFFKSKVILNDIYVIDGEGYSKRSSHQDGAKKVCEMIEQEKNFAKRYTIKGKKTTEEDETLSVEDTKNQEK